MPHQSKKAVQRRWGTYVLLALQLINFFLLAVGITVIHKFALTVRALAGLQIDLLREDASV